MKIEAAPMQGLVDHDFRRVHSSIFTPADKYYTPFLTPTATHKMTPKELREIDPDKNRDINLVPQMLCASVPDFLWAAGELVAMGYKEVNLNLGCPSGTVTAKKKGSGMLDDLDTLRIFLDGIFESCPLKISLKTRIGGKNADEFTALCELYSRYPAEELIVHCRLREQQYKGVPDLKAWETALKMCGFALCYNGDIFDRERAARFVEKYPQTKALMIGRGLAANPGLVDELKSGKPVEKQALYEFHAELFSNCKERINCEKPLLLHMKELWTYLGCSFEGSEKAVKQLKKSQSEADYLSAVSAIFALPLKEVAGFRV